GDVPHAAVGGLAGVCLRLRFQPDAGSAPDDQESFQAAAFGPDRARARRQPDRGARPLLRLHRRAGLLLRRRARRVSRGRLLVLAAVLVAVAAFFASGAHRYFSFESIKARQAGIEAWTAAHPWQAMAGYFLAYVAVTGLSLPGAALMTLLGGALFGLLWGSVIVSFASTIGATLAFFASRFVLRDWVQRRFARLLE